MQYRIWKYRISLRLWEMDIGDITALSQYYPCSENKGADQLRGYREADLRLCFRLCKLLVFSRGGSIIDFYVNFELLD